MSKCSAQCGIVRQRCGGQSAHSPSPNGLLILRREERRGAITGSETHLLTRVAIDLPSPSSPFSITPWSPTPAWETRWGKHSGMRRGRIKMYRLGETLSLRLIASFLLRMAKTGGLVRPETHNYAGNHVNTELNAQLCSALSIKSPISVCHNLNTASKE